PFWHSSMESAKCPGAHGAGRSRPAAGLSRRVPVAGRAAAGGALDHLGEADHGHEILLRNLAAIDLLEEVHGVLDPPELRVVVLDVPGRQLADALHLDFVDHRREDLLPRLVPVPDGDPDELSPAVFHALVAQPDGRGLPAALQLVYEDRRI